MNKIFFLAAFFISITGVYADSNSKTPLLDSQNWTLDSELINSATCAQSISTSLQPPSAKDEYFIAYDHPYNAGPSGHLEVWFIGTMYFPRLDQVSITTVSENLITQSIYSDNYTEKKLLYTKVLQAKSNLEDNRLMMYARQMDGNGKVIESCDYTVDSLY
jgi:hypothetical protein